MSRWLAKIRGRPVRLLAPVALLALAPKCLLCVAAYAGIGAALGLGGPELCGAPAGAWAPMLLISGAVLGCSVFAVVRWRRRSLTLPTTPLRG